MNPTVEQLLQTKTERRQRLAQLPFEEKLEILRQLRDFGLEARTFRKTVALSSDGKRSEFSEAANNHPILPCSVFESRRTRNPAGG